MGVDGGLIAVTLVEVEAAGVIGCTMQGVFERAGFLGHLRNELAHGSPMLTRQVLGTIELVAEILSQLYPAPATA